MYTHKPPRGTKVIVRPEVDAHGKYAGVVFEVVEHKQVNVVIADQHGFRLRCKPEYLDPAPTGDQPTAPVESLPPLYVGEVFTVTAGTLRGVDETTLLVVIGLNGLAYKAALLGGNKNRYFRNVARASMRPVPLDQILNR